MFRIPLSTAAAAFLAIAAPSASGQVPRPTVEATARSTSYAALVDRLLVSPILIDATIVTATKLKGPDALGVAPGSTRYYLEADVSALIRGPAGMPVRIGYLADVPLDWRGKAPKLKRARVLLFARPVAGRPGTIQLTGVDGQHPRSPALDTLVREIARDIVAPDAAPAITGIGNAFHVAGSLPGEGETQIFLTTADGRPVSLSVLRRPGEQPRWAVALSEIVDESAGPPPRDTFLWYRLACGLPRDLPDRSLATMDGDNARIAREDFAFVQRALGACDR